MVINLIIIGGQVLIIFIGGRAISVTRLNGPQWGISVILGALSIPVAMLIRLIPDRFAEKLIQSCKCPMIRKPFELREMIVAVDALVPKRRREAEGRSA